MAKYLIMLWFTLGLLNSNQVQQPSDQIVGIWFNEDRTNKIEIYKTKDSYSGKVVWISQLDGHPGTQPKDKHNPNPDLRSRNIMGMDIMTGLRYEEGKWIKGTIYSPKRGVYANCKVELLSKNRLKLFVSKSGITKTQTWTRE